MRQSPEYHSLGPYKYCPFCADTLRRSDREELPRLHCPSCDRLIYHNPVPAAGGVILDDDKVLLVRRKFEPKIGAWTLPAGFMEYHESAEACAKRELQEETGLIADVTSLFGVYSAHDDPRNSAVLILYSMETTAGQLTAGDDALEVQYFASDRLPEDIAFAAHKQVLVDLYGNKIKARWSQPFVPRVRTTRQRGDIQ